MLITGVDTELTLRGKYDLPPIADFAVSKQVNGSFECYEDYMVILDRVSNLICALDFAFIDDYLNEAEQYCIYHRLYELLSNNSTIPGMLPVGLVSAEQATAGGNGIGFMAIQKGFTPIFTIG